MKKYLAMIGAAALAMGLSAEDLKPAQWEGGKGEAATDPKVTMIASQESDAVPAEGEEAIGVLLTAQADGNWQALTGIFSAPIDLSKYSGIAFDVKQTFYHDVAAFVMNFKGEQGGGYINVNSGKPGEWQHVEVMFDDPAWQGKVAALKLTKIGFYGYAEINRVGETLAIANLELLEKE